MDKSTTPANQNETESRIYERMHTKEKLAILIAEVHSSGIFYGEAVTAFKKLYITHVLRSCNGRQSRACIELNMHRNTLSRVIAELGLRREDWDPKLQLSGRFPVRHAVRTRVA